MLGAIYGGAILGGAIMCLIGLVRVRLEDGPRKTAIVAALTVLGAAIGGGLGAHLLGG